MNSARNRALLDWYHQHQRSLPWRDSTDPWAILVSEVMAQQTQVTRVAPKFELFMERYPTPGDFAEASDLDMLAVWSGLGYNSRALRLRSAAQAIATDGWPTDSAGLLGLPGVGRYTAAAVACFAFGEQLAAVDTNLRRVLSRWLGAHLAGGQLEAAADMAVEIGDAAHWNQAVMDLGALVCRPRQPLCEACPVAEWCQDPSVYEPPRSQGAWPGSNRQARGSIVRMLLNGPHSIVELVDGTTLEESQCAAAMASLLADGLVRSELDDRYSIAR